MSADTTGKTSKGEPRTDWRRLRSMTDEEVHAAVLADEDIKPTDEAFWSTARLVVPELKRTTRARSDARFKRTVRRLCYETYWLNAYQIAISELRHIESIGVDFFRVSFVALHDAQLIRLVRILDRNPRAASFWYLHRSDQKLVEMAMKQASLDIADLADVSGQLYPIRNRSFVHIDKKGVFDPQQLYRDAGIDLDRLSIICVRLWEVTKELHRILYNNEFEYDDYQGSDISVLVKLRDKAEIGGLW